MHNRVPMARLLARPWFSGSIVLLAALLAGPGCSGNGKNAPPVIDPGPEKEDKPTARPYFKDVTSQSGVNATYRNGEAANHLAILESLGGGVGVVDFDGDGLLDIFVAGGGHYGKTDKELGERPRDPQELDRLLKTTDRSSPILGHPCKLYRNLGNWKFEDVSERVLKLQGPWFYTHGCTVGDYDCDGWPDLLITGWGRLALLRNEPATGNDPTKRVFVDVTEKAKLTAQTWSSSGAFGDLDGDGYPELYVCCYADWSWKKHPLCNYDGRTDDVCPPKNFKGLKHKLYQNNRDGTFKDISDTVEVLKDSAGGAKGEGPGLREGSDDASKGLGVILVDLNSDGRADIYVANDTVDNFLYFNQSKPGQIKLIEKGFSSGTARDEKGQANGSMGVDAGDPDNRGVPSIFVTNYEGEKHALYMNDWKPGKGPDQHFFTYWSAPSGIASLGFVYVSWGTGFVDFNHDGWEDLIFVSGHAIRFPSGKDSPRRQRPVLMINRADGKGRFRVASQEGGDYFQQQNVSRGLALGDLDNDGKIDAIICNTNDPVVVLRNVADTGGNGWLGVDLSTKDHRDVVGARIRLEVDGKSQWRFVKGGGSYASARDPRHTFGLGKGKPGRLTVTWPDGTEQTWDNLEPNRYHKLVKK